MLLLYRLGENRFSVSDFPLLYSLYRWHVCFCIIHPSASYTAEKTLLFPGTYWSNNCHSGLKFPHSSYFLFYMFSKVYLKTKKMTDISQTQADFKAKSRRNPLWIPRLFNAKSGCVCRNRRYFRRFRYTLWIFWVKHAAGCRCSQSPAAFCAAVHCLFLQPNRCGKPEQKRTYFVTSWVSLYFMLVASLFPYFIKKASKNVLTNACQSAIITKRWGQRESKAS